jgi:hypothetical protein
MRRASLAMSLVALLLFMGAPSARADEAPELADATAHLMKALTDLGVTVSIAVIQELGKVGEQLAKEHLEAEHWRGPAIDADEEYVGGFNLKLYPQGKSRSDEHFRAETFYRLDRHGLKEFEFNTSRPKEPSR